jgi:glycine cleavage system aminomethyltransferase T
VLAGVAGAEAVGLPYLTFFSVEDTLCFRTGKTGEFGYDLLVPRDQEESLSARFEEVGGAFDLAWAGLEALEVCALENWFFNIRREGRFGLTPLELQLQWRVSPRKRFLGSEVLEERRSAGIDARVTFIQAAGPVGVGQRVFLGNRDVGGLLNAAPSPSRGDHLGLALIDLAYACSGLGGFHVETEKDRVPVRTISPPAIHNRSLFVNPQLHSYFTRHTVDFPPVAPGPAEASGSSETGGVGRPPDLSDPRDAHV